MLCFIMNSRLVFKTIEKALVLSARQATSAEIEPRWAPPTQPLTAQVWSESDYGDDIDDDDDDYDDDDDDDDDGFIWNLLERLETQMLCFTMNSRLVFKIIEKPSGLGARQVTSAGIKLRWTPPRESLSRQGSSGSDSCRY